MNNFNLELQAVFQRGLKMTNKEPNVIKNEFRNVVIIWRCYVTFH